MKSAFYAAALAAFLSAPGLRAQFQTEGAVRSYEQVEVAEFNRSVEGAFRHREAWTKSALSVALKLVGEVAEAKTTIIELTSRSAEDSNAATALITREGLLDDSVRGVKHKLELERHAGGWWRVKRAQRAISCQPRRGHADYSSEPCR